MMGYTHAAIGAAGAVGLAFAMGNITPENYVVATMAGVIGGVLVDIDVRDNKSNFKKMTDASRTRWAMLGLTLVSFLLDYFLKLNLLHEIIQRKYIAATGTVLFLAILCVARKTKGHRTFSHSLLFIIITSLCLCLIYLPMAIFYFVGSLLHILIDLLNNPVPGPYNDWSKKHGIWLLYPVVKGKGIAFCVCKAGGTGNKVIYYIGIVTYTALSFVYCMALHGMHISMPIAVVLCYLLISLHFVRSTSEKELQANAK